MLIKLAISLELLRPFFSEGLVDSRTFLIWLVQQMGASNLAQVGFLVRLADEYLDGIMRSRPLARPFIDACLSKLSEVESTHFFFYIWAYQRRSDSPKCDTGVSCRHRSFTEDSSPGTENCYGPYCTTNPSSREFTFLCRMHLSVRGCGLLTPSSSQKR